MRLNLITQLPSCLFFTTLDKIPYANLLNYSWI